jgi:hypothetical protein
MEVAVVEIDLSIEVKIAFVHEDGKLNIKAKYSNNSARFVQNQNKQLTYEHNLAYNMNMILHIICRMEEAICC